MGLRAAFARNSRVEAPPSLAGTKCSIPSKGARAAILRLRPLRRSIWRRCIRAARRAAFLDWRPAVLLSNGSSKIRMLAQAKSEGSLSLPNEKAAKPIEAVPKSSPARYFMLLPLCWMVLSSKPYQAFRWWGLSVTRTKPKGRVHRYKRRTSVRRFHLSGTQHGHRDEWLHDCEMRRAALLSLIRFACLSILRVAGCCIYLLCGDSFLQCGAWSKGANPPALCPTPFDKEVKGSASNLFLGYIALGT